MKRHHWIELIVLFILIIAIPIVHTQQEQSPTPTQLPQKEFVSQQSPLLLFGQVVPNNALVNDRLQEAIAFHIDHAEKTSLVLSRMSELQPYITALLSDHGLHPDYVYLFAWESGLKANANSGKAVGFAQFVVYTGSRYGLTITSLSDSNGIWDIDERRCPIAFEAATRHLQDLKEDLGNDWLAAAAYNAGTGHIRAKTKEQETNNYWELFLHQETEYYLYYIMGLKIIHERHSIPFTPQSPITFNTMRMELKKDTPLVILLRQHSASEKEAQANIRWNMHFREGIIPAYRPVTIYLQRPYSTP